MARQKKIENIRYTLKVYLKKKRVPLVFEFDNRKYLDEFHSLLNSQNNFVIYSGIVFNKMEINYATITEKQFK